MNTILPRIKFDFPNYKKTLRYCFYTMRRPLDGFWDLIHEKRGSLAAANTIVLVTVIVEVLRAVLTNFQFINTRMETFNGWFTAGAVILPIFLWCVANWSLTTLFDGKGHISYIYMGTAYALVPMVLINAFLIPISHVITFDEGGIYWVLTSIGILWSTLLLLCAMKQIHDYSFAKTILTSISTIAAIGIMLFIFILFFAVISDGFAYFYSIFQEAMYRFRTG